MLEKYAMEMYKYNCNYLQIIPGLYSTAGLEHVEQSILYGSVLKNQVKQTYSLNYKKMQS